LTGLQEGKSSTLSLRSTRTAMVGVLLLATALYSWRLGEAPVYLGWDEARTAVQGYSLATTGRDMTGARLPLLFHITDPLIPNHSSVTWWQPFLFYLTAAMLRVAPIAQWSVRLPNIGLAMVNIWLAYLIAKRLFGNPWYGVLAAGMLALTPAHFFFARLAQDYFCPLPFVLLWLWCLLRYLPTDKSTEHSALGTRHLALAPRATIWLAAAAGFALGAGLYTHISSWIAMPFYFVATHVVLRVSRKPLRAHAAVSIGFAVALVPLIVWVSAHPTLLHDMFQNYGVATSSRVGERVTLYWDYFNPSYLFFAGGADPMWSTRRVGVFVLAFAVLLPCGTWHIVRRGFSIPRALLVAGFLFAPLPIALTLPEAPRYATARDLLVLPFGVFIAVAGVEFLLANRRLIARTIAALLLASIPIQFLVFAGDYFTDYQLRSAFRHDFLNVRGVVEYAIASDAGASLPAVYLSDDLSAGKVVQWKFHLITHGREDLWPRTRYFSIDAFQPDRIPAGSLLIVTTNNPRLNELIGPNRCTIIHSVKDVTGTDAAAILLKN